MEFKRVILIVLDSVGVGELPDAADYGDIGADTLGHLIKNYGLKIPNMAALGLSKIVNGLGNDASSAYGKMDEASPGKDTTTGHWEISGLILNQAFPTYPEGFPAEIMDAFHEAIGMESLGNYASSGTEIIAKLGNEHVISGKPIIYTSADSVFQIAAHEEVIHLDNLYEICEKARKILVGKHTMARVIARPFTGIDGDFKRTENRRDFACDPFEDTMLDMLKEKGKDVIGIGKIEDIFNKKGLTNTDHTTNNTDGIDATIKWIKKENSGLIFTNLVDFDMLFGHRNNPEGYKEALEYFDSKLPEIMAALNDDDLLIITADHGCDPTLEGTDHTREYVPLLVHYDGITQVDLGVRKSFSDIAATVSEIFGLEIKNGESFLKEL